MRPRIAANDVEGWRAWIDARRSKQVQRLEKEWGKPIAEIEAADRDRRMWETAVCKLRAMGEPA